MNSQVLAFGLNYGGNIKSRFSFIVFFICHSPRCWLTILFFKSGFYQTFIEHHVIRKKTKVKLGKNYGDSALSTSMVIECSTEFRYGRASTMDSERSRRVIEVCTPERVIKIHYSVGR